MTRDETTTPDVIYQLTRDDRLMIADVLDGLDDAQWQAPTLCEGWTVHHMTAHLLQPMVVGFGRFFATALRYRGDTDRTVDAVTRRLARRPRAELIALLRSHASDQVAPPRVGPIGPFADACVHLRDIARPLGLAADVPVEHWRILLGYLTGPRPAPALVARGRLDGLAFRATDVDFGAGIGTGEQVTGPAEALGMAVTGRPAALDDLSGPGVRLLRTRLSRAAAHV